MELVHYLIVSQGAKNWNGKAKLVKSLKGTMPANAVAIKLNINIPNAIFQKPENKTGIELITRERREQIKKHRRSIRSDVDYNAAEQLRIGARKLLGHDLTTTAPSGWNIEIWSKMVNKTRKEKLIIAGALIAAEIDRLQALEK